LLVAGTGMPLYRAAKLAQFLNVVLSTGLTWYLLKAVALLGPPVSLRLGALAFLGILPVYYKSFAFVRGEPFVACFTIAILYYLTLMILQKRFTSRNALLLGLLMGLSALSRQWSLLLLPSIFLLLAYSWFRLRPARPEIARVTGLSFIVTTLVAGWFYLYLRLDQGTFTPFNREAADRFSFGNQPPEFYSGLGSGLLFKVPVRPNFTNEFIPTMYSEVWGDYWGYFSVYAIDTRTATHLNGRDLTDLLAAGPRPIWLETNYDTISGYLGRVNLVSLLPSALALVSIGGVTAATLSKRSRLGMDSDRRSIFGFLLLAIGTTLAGYAWFLIMYPRLDKGDTVKATYLLHLFPLLAVTAGATLHRVEQRSPRLYRLLLGMLGLVCLHNLGAMVSHH
jgi:hypothetical protein